MKKFKRIAYIILIIIVAVLSLTIYTNASKDEGETQKEKVFAEIKFVENKLMNLLNNMNNIKFDNYNIVTTEISKQQTNSDSSQEEGGSQSRRFTKSEVLKVGQSKESGESGDEKKQETFDLKPNEILTKQDEEINWDSIKGEIENLHADLPSITMDLYQIGKISQDDILNFNKEYDNLTSLVKEEDKEQILEQLAKIYEFLPKFLRASEQEELDVVIVETKLNIYKAYAKLDGENWEQIDTYIRTAINTYSKLLTDTNIQPVKQSNISKGYIMLNELQNAVNIQDKELFLIKYKNVLEEINNM